MVFDSSTSSVLRVRDAGKRYENRWVLSGVSFEVAAGESVALTGPSGSGKTTLLNLAGGVDRPDAGEICLGRSSLRSLGSDDLARLRREYVGTVFQFFHLLPTLSAAENVELPLRLLGRPESEIRKRVAEALERIGLAHRAEALPSELSGGEQQRIAIARAVVHRPRLILADEPTGNLDSANGREVLALLGELVREAGTALLLVTHSDEAAAACHRKIHLRDGHILQTA